ncbi:MAG: ribonuclease Y [Gemmatimonadales bacterium]
MSQSLLTSLLGGAFVGLVAAIVGIQLYIRKQHRSATGIETAARREADKLIADSRKDAESAKTAAVLAGKEDALRMREEAERDSERRRDDLQHQERRAEDRERALERRAEQLAHQEEAVVSKLEHIVEQEVAVAKEEKALDTMLRTQREKLERISGMGKDAARQEVLRRAEEEAKSEAAALARDIKEQAKRTAEREGKRLVAMAAQRLASDYTAESTVAAVTLPSDEMKGRIIGREGRNIRAFETATGVDVIIDDTPDTVVISCFNPIRREVARRSLEALITDGRIHPGRIEEVVEKMRAELEVQLVELGEEAAYDTGVHGLHPEMIKLVGRMRYRTSYGQNILEHSKEVAWLAGSMAAELKCDVALAKRGALLHDIGKVLTHESEGTHVELGVEMATKYGEAALVINCIHAHHDDAPHESTESVLVQTADAISGSRPGARREAFETYVKRLTRLEAIANAFDGVEKSNVIQAGREIRVVVHPEQVDDAKAASLSDEIARKVEIELQYPGQIKVVVIRETRAVDFAR